MLTFSPSKYLQLVELKSNLLPETSLKVDNQSIFLPEILYTIQTQEKRK